MGGFLGDLGDGLKSVGGGIKDGINDGLKAGGDLIDAGKKKLGEGVDYVSDKAGDALDRAGLDKAGDIVHSAGDHIAAGLGATPTEQGLGHTDDPTQLVHGNPGNIRESAKHLKDFHSAFDKVGRGMKKVDASGWKGEAADAFHTKISIHPTKWAQAAEACSTAAEALDSYADTIKWAQDKAQDAIDTYKRGQHSTKTSADAYNKKADAYNAKVKAGEDPGPRPDPWHDPGEAERKKAEQILEDARRARNDSAAKAEAAIGKALAHAPAEPPPLTQISNTLVDASKFLDTESTHLLGGVIKGTAGLVNFARGLNPTDPYNLTHPAAYYQNVNMTLAGLASTASHPDRIVTGAVAAFKDDPSEFIGTLLPEAIGTKGAGFAKSGLRMGLRSGEKAALKEGAEGAARKSLRDAERGTDYTDGPNKPARAEESVVNKGSDPVDMATGKMYLPQIDITLPGTLPLGFTRRAESGYHLGRWFGPSWSSTVDQHLEIDAEGVIFVTEDGRLLNYPHPAPGIPVLPSHGAVWPLDRTDDGYTITAPETGRVWHFSDRTDRLAVLEQIDDRHGNWLTFEHDASGSPRGIASSAGYHLKITTAEGRITSLHLAHAAADGTDQEIKRYGYTPQGHLGEVINSSGKPLRFTYDERGRVTSWTDTNDRSYTYEYDAQDRCIAEGGSDGHMALRFDYDCTDQTTGHRVTTTTTGEGHTRRFLVNNAYQVVAEVDPLGNTTHFARDRRNRLLSRTDPLGHTTSFAYDDAGNLVTATRPDGRKTRIEHNALGLMTRVTGPDGMVRRQTYDERGNRTSVTSPSGQTTRFTYDEAGRLQTVTDPLGNTIVIRCNRAGLPVEITDALGATTSYLRDAFGRPITITDPTGAVSCLEWTVEGQLSRRIAPDGTSESWTYDGEGNCTSHTDALRAVTSFEYTHFDLLAARITPEGMRHEFEHDTELRLTKVTNPQGLSWNYTFDAAGRLASETDFDGRTVTYAHDASGRLSSRSNTLGQTTHFERNTLGQVIRKNVDGLVTKFAYDFTDQLAQAVGPDGAQLTILRDRYGRVHSEVVDGREIAYAYDELGRRIGRTTPTGAATNWTYDAAGRRSGLVSAGRSINLDYDAAGRELARHIGDTITYQNSFDLMGRLTEQSVTSVDGRTLQQRAYTYRADGNLTAVEDYLNCSRRFDVDRVGRVTAVHAGNWTETYAYDPAGNVTDASWPTEHPGREAIGSRTYVGTRITHAGNVRYEHDQLGRITLRQKPRPSRKPDTWRYQWDAEDRLAEVLTPEGTRWRYTYDPLGRRTAKYRLGDDGRSIAEQTVFTWDGTLLCEQTHAAQELPNPVTLTWDHQGMRPIAQTERITAVDSPQEEIDSRFFAIITDLVGAPTELIDEHGEIAWRTRNTLWGATTWNTDATSYTPLRFPGQYYDPETGLHYNYFRHYDPETARYLTADPLGLAPSPNPVRYVSNPTLFADPLGLAPVGCPEEEHLFRGTTRGYDASSGTQASGYTPTSTDPGVATAFARHSEQYGEAVVHLIPRSTLDDVATAPGFIRAEAEVGVELSASELAKRASIELPVETAQKILGDMGIHVPKVNSIGGITDALEWDIPKLTPDQISNFVREAYKHG
ncbi:putative T7SS-secreted protein [Streptomyces sp. NPDC050085]|uniref:putative T7SS-secreted protein n=1 Tax=Streptomyces sp. NPDC050085 TaxID=3365600 RepID=UPI003797EFB4